MEFTTPAIPNFGDGNEMSAFLEHLRSHDSPECFVQLAEKSLVPNTPGRVRAGLQDQLDHHDKNLAALWMVTKLLAAALLKTSRDSQPGTDSGMNDEA